MKKIFPVIIILITLSLIGIIYIQVSWFRSMLINKEEQLAQRVVKSLDEVGTEMVEENTLPQAGSFRRPRLSFPSDQLSLELMNPASVASKFTEFEIKEKLQRAFGRNDLKNTDFEFAITSNTNMFGYEQKSSHFLKLLDDTSSSRTRTFVYPLQSPGFMDNVGNGADNLGSNEALMVIVPNLSHVAFVQLGWMLAGAISFLLIIIAAFAVTVRALLRQKKLSEIKNDFINNMTHEFKTPISTISLAVDALKNEKVMHSADKMHYFRTIIKEENARMNKQVETILQAALTDRQKLQLSLTEIHVHKVINSVLENFELQLEDKKAKKEVKLHAGNDLIQGDEVHFTNIIANLIDNAVKYSKENLLLKITTTNNGQHLIIKIEDNGIGMNKETVKRIFEKFYRAHTGNRHDVKGFGLGLSYVKTIVNAHHGKIKAESVVGKGSVFTIELPLFQKQEASVPIT